MTLGFLQSTIKIALFCEEISAVWTVIETEHLPIMEQAPSTPTADAVKLSTNRSLRSRVGENFSAQNVDLLLLLCCLVSGLIDSTIYNGRNHSTNGPSCVR